MTDLSFFNGQNNEIGDNSQIAGFERDLCSEELNCFKTK